MIFSYSSIRLFGGCILGLQCLEKCVKCCTGNSLCEEFWAVYSAIDSQPAKLVLPVAVRLSEGVGQRDQ